jgi:hypothetical protein
MGIYPLSMVRSKRSSETKPTTWGFGHPVAEAHASEIAKPEGEESETA